jgi:hypothetical protein
MNSKHDFCLYRPISVDGYSEFLGLVRPTERGDDIWAELRSLPTFIVDNNLPPKRLANTNRGMNFVIGAARTDECEDLDSELFGNIPSGGCPNLFKTGFYGEVVEFHRLDEGYRDIFRCPPPRAKEYRRTHLIERQLAADSLRSIVQTILPFDGGHIEDLIEKARIRCFGNVETSAYVAACAYAVYIKKCSEQRRTNLLKTSYLNFPNDARLIAEALCFGFGIASADIKDVHEMAKIARVAARTGSQLGIVGST